MIQPLKQDSCFTNVNLSTNQKNSAQAKNLNKLAECLQRIIFSYLTIPEQLNSSSTSKQFAALTFTALEKNNWGDHQIVDMVPQYYKWKYRNIEYKMKTTQSSFRTYFTLFDILSEKTKYIAYHQASPGVLYESLTSQNSAKYLLLRSIEIFDPYKDPFLSGICWSGDNSTNPNDDLFKIISQTCPNLQKLVFKFFDSANIKIDSLSEIINACPFLNDIQCYVNSHEQLIKLSKVPLLTEGKPFPLTLLHIDEDVSSSNEDYKIELASIISYSPFLQSFKIDDFFEFDLLENLGRHCPQLTSVEYIGNFSVKSLTLITQNNNLRFLYMPELLYEILLSQPPANDWYRSCKHLLKLDILGFDLISKNKESHKTLNYNTNYVCDMVESLPHIQSLKMPLIYDLHVASSSDIAFLEVYILNQALILNQIGKHNPDLTELELRCGDSYQINFDDDSLIALIKGCTQLKTLKFTAFNRTPELNQGELIKKNIENQITERGVRTLIESPNLTLYTNRAKHSLPAILLLGDNQIKLNAHIEEFSYVPEGQKYFYI